MEVKRDQLATLEINQINASIVTSIITSCVPATVLSAFPGSIHSVLTTHLQSGCYCSPLLRRSLHSEVTGLGPRLRWWLKPESTTRQTHPRVHTPCSSPFLVSQISVPGTKEPKEGRGHHKCQSYRKLGARSSQTSKMQLQWNSCG